MIESPRLPSQRADRSPERIDVALIGGGIMSATLGSLLTLLEPTWRIHLYERLDEVAQESSGPWNNAGTGHAALCELNYTPERADGSIDITKAVTINEQFEASREYWHHLLTTGALPEPADFITRTPHMTFVRGEANVDFLRRRHATMVTHPLFRDLEFSDDPAVIADWAPLLIADRDPAEPVAATRATAGTDVDFGALTRALVDFMVARGARLHTRHEVRGLRRRDDGWRLRIADRTWNAERPRVRVDARFVFVGAGGGALPLLQKSGIAEAKGYGGFPISGHFLRTSNPELVARHRAKVYGRADVGAPPMSVPHLDTRVIDGREHLMFGPYAGFSPRYLKRGRYLGLFTSLRGHNVAPMLGAGMRNLDLTRYLLGQLAARPETKFHALQRFMPTAHPKDWETITAGQRVQVIRRDADGRGTLEFGTEVVASSDGTIAGLLGASPGASTAVSAMIDVLERCFPDRFARDWAPLLAQMIPSRGQAPWEAGELDALEPADQAG